MTLRNPTPELSRFGAALPPRRLPGRPPARGGLTSGGGEQAHPRPLFQFEQCSHGVTLFASYGPYRGGVVGCAMCPPSSLLEPGARHVAPGDTIIRVQQ